MTCPICLTPVAPGARFCPSCGAAQPATDAPTRLADSGDAATRISGDAPTMAAAAGHRPASAPPTPAVSGWLSSSGSIDHGRFAPGTILDSRYRIVGLLGRGGMGEVYRADDLRLGQSVALKFLPPDLGRDAVRLSQFHNEVRTARQVSHANVCRVYDIGEIGDQIYLSMEYVDGEDLASLLRRIGRLPEDKAIEIARQVCAGLAAAHERGIIHRDLKPANIMLDGAGRARIMDFSLAAVGEVTDVRSGTPAYMAPEQLAGKEVTARSDIYALGLVLYELFTGRRAYDAKTLGDLIEQHASGSITAPTDLVKTLDQSIERAILRCLEPDPARRPATALAVAAALPGGDPVAAALAAGETPSPEMVAAVGGDAATVTPLVGVACVTLIVAMLFGLSALADRTSILSRTPFAKPAAVLADRAESIRQALGYTAPAADHAEGFSYSGGYLSWASKHGAGEKGWANLAVGSPSVVRFWYRTSPGALIPSITEAVSTSDPPVGLAGMTELEIDPLGRLWSFSAVPPEHEPEGPASPVDWTPLFTAASLDLKSLAAATPGRTPPTFADERRAWVGTFPGTDIPMHVEAAAYRGRPVYFTVLGSWSPAPRDLSSPPSSDNVVSVIAILVLLVVAAFLARANLRSGRADRRGAFRLGTFVALILMASWVFGDHVKDIVNERMRFFVSIGVAMFVGGAMYLIYLALEPHIRRSWPSMIVAWSRVLQGRVRDAVVGRDVLFATVVGVIYAGIVITYARLPWFPSAASEVPHQPDLAMVTDLRHWVLTLLASMNSGLQNGLINVFTFVLTREGIRGVAHRRGRRGPWLDRSATVIAILFVVALSSIGNINSWEDVTFALLTTSMEVFVALRIGLFASCTMSFVRFLVERLPLTLDANRFYAVDGWVGVALVVAIAAAGFWLARADEPLFGRPTPAAN